MSFVRAVPARDLRSDRRTTVALVRPAQSGPLLRHVRTHGGGRRDARRFTGFGQAIAAPRPLATSAPVLSRGDNLRFFVQAFAGAFLFVTLFIA